MTYSQNKNHDIHHARAGFTLAELLVTIVILGILLAFVVPAYRNLQSGRKKDLARHQLKLLESAIELFELDFDKPPQRITDLVRKPAPSDYYDQESLADWPEGQKGKPGGYLAKGKIPKDPWGGKYQYKLTPGGPRPYELYSYGPKKKGAPKSEWIRLK